MARRRDVPGDAVEHRAGPPAVFVHGAVAVDLEVLLRVALGRGGVVECVQEAGALHRPLLHAVDDRGLRDPGRFQDGRADVDAVRELAAPTAPVLDAARPGDDHAVTRAAQVAGDLLAPREGAVACPGPGRRVVRRGGIGAPGAQAAVVLDQGELLSGGERDAVLHRELVERASEGAFHAGAVVAPDVEDQGVVEFAHLLDRVEQAADVPVGVLLEAGVDLHLPGVELLLLR